MTENGKSDPRKVHIGPIHSRQEEKNNVVQLPTEVIEHKVEDTWLHERVDIPNNRDKVKAAVKKCQTALVNNKTGKSRENKENKANVEKGQPQRDASGRQTISADIIRHREIREKCYTIREVFLTGLTIFVCINVVIFMIWLQFLLYSWSHS